MATLQANGKAEANGSIAAETNNNTVSPIPAWVHAKLFEELLQKNEPSFKRIVDFQAKPALNAGENYASLMLRIEIELELQDGQTKSLSYMMKVGHDNESAEELSKIYSPFSNETDMYLKIVPHFEELYYKAGVDVKFSCQYFKLNTEQEHILLEDLRPCGFKNADRLQGLDMEHSKCVLKKLAQWHAASAVLCETKGKYADLYVQGFFTEGARENIKMMNASRATQFQRCLKTYEGHEVYEEAVIKAQEHMVDQMFKGAKPDASEFNVLNHGDVWCNNIMFQYNAEGNVEETYFVDYQYPKYGTPAQDLYYFIMSSTKMELKLKHFEYFIKYYHEQLVQHLQLLKYSKQVPSLKEIHIMLYKYGYWALDTAAGVMAAILLEPTESATLANFIANSEDAQQFKLMMFSREIYRKHIEQILPWLHNRGAMDYL